jgi:WD40 repeat protein
MRSPRTRARKSRIGPSVAFLLATIPIASGVAQEPAHRLFQGHDGNVSVAFSPDGKTLLTGADDALLKLWDVPSARLLRTIPTGEQPITKVAISPDGALLVVSGADHRVRLWDARTGALNITLEGHRHQVSTFAFSSDGKMIASGGFDRNVFLWDVETGRRIRLISGHARKVFSVSFSPDGAWVASAGGDGMGTGGELLVWDAATGQLKWGKRDTKEIQIWAVAFSPDGKTLAAGNMLGVVRLFDADSGKVLRTIDAGDDLRSLAFSPDGKLLAAGIRKEIKLWDPATGELVTTLPGSTNWVGSLAFSRDGKRLASGCTDGTAIVWELAPFARVSGDRRPESRWESASVPPR